MSAPRIDYLERTGRQKYFRTDEWVNDKTPMCVEPVAQIWFDELATRPVYVVAHSPIGKNDVLEPEPEKCRFLGLCALRNDLPVCWAEGQFTLVQQLMVTFNKSYERGYRIEDLKYGALTSVADEVRRAVKENLSEEWSPPEAWPIADQHFVRLIAQLKLCADCCR